MGREINGNNDQEFSLFHVCVYVCVCISGLHATDDTAVPSLWGKVPFFSHTVTLTSTELKEVAPAWPHHFLNNSYSVTNGFMARRNYGSATQAQYPCSDLLSGN